MIAFSKFTAKEFLLTLKYLYILSIRYNIICHLSPNEQEKNYNQISVKIYNDIHKRASHIKNSDEFKILYPDDKAFRNAFEFIKMPADDQQKKSDFYCQQLKIILAVN